MNKFSKFILLAGCALSLSACVEDDYNSGYYSTGGSQTAYRSEAVNSGYNRDYQSQQQNTQDTYTSTQSAGGGYYSSSGASSSGSSNSGYSSSQSPAQNVGGYTSN